MKTTLLSVAFSAFAFHSFAGEATSSSDKQAVAPPPEPAPYEAGRGLITLEGPTGMFINPTSATLPQGAFTAQYCFFLPENDSDPWGHGGLLAYGVTDWLEVGAIGNYISLDEGEDPIAGGPFARVRLLKDEGWIPQLSIGAYSEFGDTALERYGVFAAWYKRIPIDEDGFIKSIGFHGGLRQTWHESPVEDVFNTYSGIEIQLPFRLYLVGEVALRDHDAQAETPYAFGVQWRAAGVNISVAGIQNGNVDDPAFYFGIGTAWSF
ncbi:MAG: hypothetical protein ACR2OZ_16175 [Verrucomicrobiales bacterium]